MRLFSKSLLSASFACASSLLYAQAAGPRYPLDGLSTAEYWAVHDVLAASGHLTDDTYVASLLLHEPTKQVVLAWHSGMPIPREADVVLTSGGKTFEALVDIQNRKLESYKEAPEVQAPITEAELNSISDVAIKDPRVLTALKKRGITDLTSVECEPIPLTFRVFPQEESHRIGYGDCTNQHGAYHAWGRIIEGLYILADFGENKILNVVDTGAMPMPVEDIDFEEAPAVSRPGTKPIVISQPDGASYSFDETGAVSWQNWHFRFRLDPRIGAVVNQVAYQDGDRLRSIMYEGSLSEMYVPYQEKNPGWSWRSFLDAGEFLYGGLIKPLNADDCPERAQFFTGYAPSSKGIPLRRENLGCLFERSTDNPAWRHFESGISSRPSRELVLRTAAVLGNYDYVLDWVFQQDGTIRIAVGATGVVETEGVKETHLDDMAHMGDQVSYGTLVAPNLFAVNHDHFFSFRLDMDVDGQNNSLMIDRMIPQTISSNNRTSIWAVKPFLASAEKDGMIDLDYRKPAMLTFVNPNVHGRLGYPTGYEIMPAATAVPIVSPDDASQRVGGFALHQLWVTPYRPDERYAGGTYVSSSKGMEGLPAWTKTNRSIENTDIVAWYTLGFHHIVRQEDWPVMPTLWHEFLIRPSNFFDRNPVLTLPHQP
jgi:primary-amine oxidase